MYTRALVATFGLFALSHDEAIYFHTFTDEDGEFLTADHEYEVKMDEAGPGGDTNHLLPSRWWSITAYAMDRFCMDNDMNKFSVNFSNVARRDGGKSGPW